MAYFKINNIDFSMYVNNLQIDKTSVYTKETNAAGDSVVDYVNNKRNITVGIIPLDSEAAVSLLNAVDGFNVSITFRNPLTNQLEENVNCIIPATNIAYYTIQADRVSYKAFTLVFNEL
jgi:hypothetical protein